MKMKDKLEKFGHKRGYYAVRSTFVGFLACLSIFSMVAIPTYIASRSGNNMSQAEEIKDDDDVEDPDVQSVTDIDL